jgi:serine/threonine protein kinase/cytochrome c-type biogenesis protein CcmH/NrfG
MAQPQSLSPGQVIVGRYKIIKLLGQGGFGAVYLVEDARLAGAKLALKESFDASKDASEQFEFEAVTLARLSHPGLARVSDRFAEHGRQFLVMDFIEGKDLTDIILNKSASEQQLVQWMIEVCDAVAYLHSQTPPIIHRDIKPPNIKIKPDGHAVLVDFGIAKVYDPQKRTVMAAKGASSGFSPPEQYTGGTDARSDVYSLGATLYCALTGQMPPEALDMVEQAAALPPPRQFNPRINPAVERVILKAMSLNTLARHPTAREMMNELKSSLGAGGAVPSIPQPPIQMPLQPMPPPTMGIICPRCGRMNRPTAKFCQHDRTPLAPPAPAINPQMRFELGNRHFSKRNFQRAADEYAQALQGGFEHGALFYNLGKTYLELDRVREAIQILQRGVGKHPQDADLYALLGRAYFNDNQPAQAERVLQSALRQDSKNLEAHLILSWLYRVTGRKNDAVQWAQKAIRIDPDISASHYLLGRAYQSLSKWNDAINAFKQAVRLDPDAVSTHLQLGKSYLEARRKREARAAFEKALQIDPGNADAKALMRKT